MDERQKQIIEKLHLNEADFTPSQNVGDRIADAEDAILELAELVGELNG